MEIEKLDHFGRGITKIDNKICFVENALPGEEVEIEKISENKKKIEAKVTKYIKKSNDREEPKCKYYNKCGGCSIGHLKYDKQLDYKVKRVEEILKRFTNINMDIDSIEDSNRYNYRNKVVLHVKDGKIGFYKNKSNNIIEVDECLLLDDKINYLISLLKKRINLNNVKKITIKLGNNTNEVMLIIDGEVDNISYLLELVDVLIINDKVISDKKYITSIIDGKKYIVSKNSFFQVNKYVVKKLYDEIKNIVIKNNSSNVLDLYSGTGTIGIYISEYVNKVLGIEVVSDAVNDSYLNKDINNCNNIDFILGKVEDKLEVLDDIDTIIVDPPRSGLDKKVIEVIKRISPNLIIYTSCDAVTLSRDLNYLKENYNIKSIKLFDMFPNTYHVECISVLERRNVEK